MSARGLRRHPARDAILDAMRQYGGPISPSQLARVTGASVGATAYPVRTLLAAEVIELVGEGRVRGAVEHFYTLVADVDHPALDPVRQLLGLCGGLTVPDPDGGFPTPARSTPRPARNSRRSWASCAHGYRRSPSRPPPVSADSGDEPAWQRHDPLQRFARNIREARAALGLSREAIALAADMDQSQYSRIERGEVDPGVRTAARVARALRVTLAQLYDGVEWMPPAVARVGRAATTTALDEEVR